MTELPTAAVCAPLDVEYRAVRGLLAGHRFTERTERGTVFAITEFEGRHGLWRLVLTLTGRHNERAATAVERTVATFAPQAIVLVGVAGGRRDARIGDVIAATEIYGYESGQDTDLRYLSRIKTFNTSHALSQQAHHAAEEGAWTERLGLAPGQAPPRVFHRPLAAGSKVVTGLDSPTAALIGQHCGDAQGVDMESFGAMAAACTGGGVEAMVVRGVSDLIGDKTKDADRTRQPLAARNAAAFALALIERLEPGPAAPDEPESQRHRGPKYVGAIGEGANATVAAMGDRAEGRITIHHSRHRD
ncbi:MAG TPA: hypothetical protein VKZ65_15780 [Glycomyces sp.]|nr:hypothetical protein [Glycomyces sp.]